MLVEMRKRGWSPDAQTLLDLYQWCVEENDLEGAGIVAEELVNSGKA
eukprot:CAMPEP_0198214370 /NCGR_PEP_ID=MMETSP1445-20131203/40877_1 /TAXON_ID=36898 /ORGANISM="Pyramimonas sp., Strain CCMP2087" /LENGTH=46 /DNA_ID= /DNA_START= /DNA_END= /DNA_ORIENTATION=